MSSEAEGLLAPQAEDVAGQDDAGRMDLKVEIKSVGPCRKHVSVTVSEADVTAHREECLAELSDRAQVPGFRIGHVPRSLLVRKFREEIAAQIKQKVLLASLEQLSAENSIDPINEPKIDVESLEVPESGDFHYEFEVEVRPEFELPDYESFTIRRPVGTASDAEFEAYREQFLSPYGRSEAIQEPCAAGDHVLLDLKFSHQGSVIRQTEHVRIRVLPVLNFQDAAIEGFDQLMIGAAAGDTRTATIRISMQSPVIEMRGEEITVELTVHQVYRTIMPSLDKEFLSSLPLGAETVEALDEHIRRSLNRQIEFQQRQAAREQVLAKIAESANWDLPESLVRQQTENALRRELLEMAQAGFTREQILARENEIRRNAIDNTRQALKEHFVLDRLATEQDIHCEDADIDRELELMSFQSGEPVRKIRAKLTKSGLIENLQAQLRERKAVDFILSKAKFEDVDREPMARNDSVGIRFAICGNMSASLLDDSGSETAAAE